MIPHALPDSSFFTSFLACLFFVQPRGVTTPGDQGHDEGEKAPAWGAPEAGQQTEREVEVAEPVYINVEGHFACLLLDDDTPVNRCKVCEKG